MKITVELAGWGHYGLCSVVSRASLEQALEKIDRRRQRAEEKGIQDFSDGDWGDLTAGLAGKYSIGPDNCLKLCNTKDGDKIKLVWRHDTLRQAMLSHDLLHCILLDFNSEDETGNGLEVEVGAAQQGWFVRANFGPDIWQVIEDSVFPSLLSERINPEIRKFFEDNYDGDMGPGQYGTVHQGINGLSLQLYQPVGSGVWIVGSRQKSFGYQFVDHNTDCSFQALAHIFSLCVVQKHCRELLVPPPESS